MCYTLKEFNTQKFVTSNVTAIFQISVLLGSFLKIESELIARADAKQVTRIHPFGKKRVIDYMPLRKMPNRFKEFSVRIKPQGPHFVMDMCHIWSIPQQDPEQAAQYVARLYDNIFLEINEISEEFLKPKLWLFILNHRLVHKRFLRLRYQLTRNNQLIITCFCF